MLEPVITIRIKETLNEDWSAWFNGLSITSDQDGSTILMGSVPDQSAVRGILGKLWDFNLTILSFSFSNSTRPERKSHA